MGSYSQGRSLSTLDADYDLKYSMGFNPGNLVPPIAHRVMDGVHYRMYVENINDVYHLHVGTKHVRRYTAEHLPNCVKEAIAFANSFPIVKNNMWEWGNTYENNHHPDLDMIGWRTKFVTPALVVYRRIREAYIIVVTRTFLEELSG